MGTMPSQLPSLFFTNVRYGGLAITYNISTSLFGGTAPLLVAWLVKITASNLAPAYYIIFASLIGIEVVTFFLKNTSGKPLRGLPPAVEEPNEIPEILEDAEDGLWWSEEKKKIDQHINESESNQE